MKKNLRIMLMTLVAVLVNKHLKNYISIPWLKWFMTCYFNDLVGGITFIAYCNSVFYYYKEDIDKMFEKNTEKSNVKNDDCKIGGHVVPDDMAKNFGAVEVDGAVDVPDHTWDEEAEMKKDTDRFHVLA